MPFAVTELKLPADKLAQLNRALGGVAGDEAAASVQGLCDEAAAIVARMTTGYDIDAISNADFIRAVALHRAYGLIGPVPKDIEGNYKTVWEELQAIAGGKRPNLKHADSPAPEAKGIGAWGSKDVVPGRIP